jgi:hypothetical protein
MNATHPAARKAANYVGTAPEFFAKAAKVENRMLLRCIARGGTI